MKIKVVPTATEVLGTPPKDNKRIRELGTGTRTEDLQKTIILRPTAIYRKVLEIRGTSIARVRLSKVPQFDNH